MSANAGVLFGPNSGRGIVPNLGRGFGSPVDETFAEGALLTDTFAEARELIDQVKAASQLFGEWPADGDMSGAKSVYKHLVGLVHPGSVAESERPAADAAFARLAGLYAAWGHSPAEAAGIPPASVEHAGTTYALGARLRSSSGIDDYAVTWPGGPKGARTEHSGILRYATDPGSNDLLVNEARLLARIRAKGEPKLEAYVPELVASLTHAGPATGIERAVEIIRGVDGFVSLSEIRAAYPTGLDVRDAAWMWRRLLVALGYAHRTGVVHGAVGPGNVLIHPELHGLVLADWRRGQSEPYSPPAKAITKSSKPAAGIAPELLMGSPVSPASDIFMATRAIETVLDAALPSAFRAFIHGCTLESSSMRPTDAWELLGELDELLERLYGPRQFRPFRMPGGSTVPAIDGA